MLEEMYTYYEKACAICKAKRKLVVDHNHTTGEVRGLLCPPCNVLVGYIEGESKLKAAQEYLAEQRVWSVGRILNAREVMWTNSVGQTATTPEPVLTVVDNSTEKTVTTAAPDASDITYQSIDASSVDSEMKTDTNSPSTTEESQ